MSAEERELKTGDRVEVVFVDGKSSSFSATIRDVLSDAQEGLSPESQDYVACWLNVQSDSGTDAPVLPISFGTDFHYYIDGRQVRLERL